MKQPRHAQFALFGLVASVCVAFICALSASGYANTITVTNTNDNGPGSLRQALSDSNDGDTIAFAVTGTIGVTTGELLVNKSVTISGPGAQNLAVNADYKSRVFRIGPDTIVAISGLTIVNGNATGPYPANEGGGVLNERAMLTLDNCAITKNSADNQGAGICNDSAGGSANLEINKSTLINNSAPFGAGICNDARMGGTALLQINNTTISGNSGLYGGGIFTIGNFGHAAAALSNCTISGNSVQTHGGGIYCVVTDVPVEHQQQSNRHNSRAVQRATGKSALTIVNSTISGNLAGVIGGGIYDHALIEIANSTLSGNSAGSGGGIYHDGGMSPLAVEVSNTVFITGASGENIFNNGGTITSLGYNLSSDNGGGYLIGPGDQINIDPMLGPLHDNGGSTETHALLPGSPAIDAGDPSFAPPPWYDQRGPDFYRLRNDRIDIGSFEVQEGPAVTPTPTPTATPTPTPRPAPTPRPRPTPHLRQTPL